MEQSSHLIATASTNGAVVVWDVEKKAKDSFNIHKTTVNRVVWHPSHAHTLLSGCQDGTMKLWDIRKGGAALTFTPKTDAVRDIQFSPFFHNYFASAFDSGLLQIFDIRKQQPKVCIAAHNGLMVSIDWHPTLKSVLCSGGRDSFLRVWDLDLSGKPIFSVQALTGISNAKWHPAHPWYVATSSTIMEHSIHTWNLEKPYIPVNSLLGHTDLVTRLLWKDSEVLFSCSKDYSLRKHFFSSPDNYYPLQHLPTVSCAWTPSNDVLGSLTLIDRNDFLRTKKTPPLTFSHYFPSSVQLSSRFNSLALHYKVSGLPFRQLCDHNAQIASSHGLTQVATLWLIIKNMFELQEEAGAMVVDPSINLVDSAPKRAALSDGLLPFNLLFNSITQSPPPPVEYTTNPLPNLNLKETMVSFIHSFPNTYPTGPPEFYFCGINKEEKQNPIGLPSGKWSVADPKQQQHEVSEPSSEPSFSSVLLKYLHETLLMYAQNGDIQTCTTISLVLDNARVPLDHALVARWTFAYIDQLQRLKLWNAANDILSSSNCIEINTLNQKNTAFYSACPCCLKDLDRATHVCKKCQRITTLCSVCHLPIKGLYRWCQICGHGGHFQCLNKWFKREKCCPSGCLHECVL